MGVIGKCQARQRVFFKRIGATLQHDRRRAQPPGDGHDGCVQHPGHFTIIEPGRHRNIRSKAPCPVTNPTGEGPAPIFMHRKREDMRVIMEGILHAIAVMRINIHIKQRRKPLIAPGQ